jgi:hypothetical protein
MNSLWDIRIFLGLVPKESPCTTAMVIRVYLHKRTTISLPSPSTFKHKDNILYEKQRDISTY